MDELCISRRQNLWLCVHAGVNWTAVSRYSGQILACVLGDRACKDRWDRVAELSALLPKVYQRRLVYTDGYGAYAAFFSAWQHRECQKFDGGTCTVEGVNNSLRHRCSFLVRRHSGPRCGAGLLTRLSFALAAHNRACQDRWVRCQAQPTQSGE
jgi:IS1 family transposase